MKKLLKIYNLSGLDLFNHPTRTAKNRLTIGKNAKIFPDHHIEKRKGYIEASAYEKFFISKSIIGIIKFLDYTVIFYSDGTVKTDYKENWKVKRVAAADIGTTRGAGANDWSHNIKKILNSADFDLGVIKDNEDVYSEIAYNGLYGNLKVSFENEDQTVAIVAGDILTVDGDDLYLPGLNGEDEIFFDTMGNAYYDEAFAQPAYFHEHRNLLSLSIKDNVKFNNIYILTDGEQLYKLYKKSNDILFNNRMFIGIGDEILINKRDDLKFINKIVLEIENGIWGPAKIFCYDPFLNRIYYMHYSMTYIDTINLQVIDLYTNTIIKNQDYVIPGSIYMLDPQKIYGLTVDEDNIWFVLKERRDTGNSNYYYTINKIDKEDYSITWAVHAAGPHDLDPYYGWFSLDVDYFGDRIFFTYIKRVSVPPNTYSFHIEYYNKSTFALIGSGSQSHSYPFTEYSVKIKIYNDYLFCTLSDNISVFKKNVGNNNYSFLISGATGRILDIIVYDKKDLDNIEIVCYYLDGTNVKISFFSIVDEDFHHDFILSGNMSFFGLNVSCDQYFKEPERIEIIPLSKPEKLDVSIAFGSSGGSLNGIYQYKMIYTNNTRKSIESDVSISITVSIGEKVIIENINIPSDCTAEIYRKKSNENDWLYIGETDGNHFVDDGSYALNIDISDRIGICPDGKSPEVFFSMLFVIGIGEYKNYLFFTTNVGLFLVENYKIFHEFNEFFGIKKFMDFLYLFGDKGVCRIAGYSAETLSTNHFNKKINQVINKTIQQYSSYFLVLQSDNKIYKFDGYNFLNISGFVLGKELEYSENNYAVIYDDKYILFANKVYVYDFVLEKFFQEPVWIEYTNYAFNYAAVIENTLFGAKSNKVYELDNSYQDIDQNITLNLKTGQLEFDDPIIRKVLERLNIIMGGLTDEIKIKLYAGDNTPEENPFEITENDERDQSSIEIRPSRGRGKFFQVEITENTEVNIKVYGIEFKYRELKFRRNNNRLFNLTS